MNDHTPKHRKPTPHRDLPTHYIVPQHCNCDDCEQGAPVHVALSSAHIWKGLWSNWPVVAA